MTTNNGHYDENINVLTAVLCISLVSDGFRKKTQEICKRKRLLLYIKIEILDFRKNNRNLEIFILVEKIHAGT